MGGYIRIFPLAKQTHQSGPGKQRDQAVQLKSASVSDHLIGSKGASRSHDGGGAPYGQKGILMEICIDKIAAGAGTQEKKGAGTVSGQADHGGSKDENASQVAQ